jgi:hypothetical protein
LPICWNTRVLDAYEQVPRGKPPAIAKFRPKTFGLLIAMSPTLSKAGLVSPGDHVSLALLTQSGLDTVDQDRSSEWLGQETSGSGLQRSGADALIGEGRNENERRVVSLSAHMHQKVQTTHGRHLHIRNDARRIVQAGRLQEINGRRKCMDHVTVRTEKIIGCDADGCIVVNNRNERKL